MEIEQQLNKLWSSFVKKMNINIAEHSIQMDIITKENGVDKECYVCFNEVVSHYFINKVLRLDSEKWDYIELTSIEYYSLGIGEIEIKSNLNEGRLLECNSQPIFVLELWSSYFFIEAKELKIDNYVYRVN